MTDISNRQTFAAGRAMARPWTRLATSPAAPWVCIFVAGAAGLAAGRAMGGDADGFESQLLLLLRFMAGMKALGVVAVAAATHWRFTRPIPGALAAAYLAALTVMAAAPGLIWSLGGIAIGALLVHAGLLTFLYLAWRDDGAPLARKLR